MVNLEKRGKLAVETLIKIIALSVVAVVILGILIAWQVGFDEQKMDETLCYVSNGLKSATISSIFPSTCRYFPIQEPVDLGGLSKILTGVWHSQGQGDWSFGAAGDEALLRYSFYLKNETSLDDLYKHLLTHRGIAVVGPKESDYNYLQSGSLGSTLCFGEKIVNEDNNILFKDQLYYIFFVDDQEFLELRTQEDKIVITKGVDYNSWVPFYDYAFKCFNPLTGEVNSVGSLDWGVSSIASNLEYFGGKE